MKAFVAGGAGFIGSHLVSRLLSGKSTERVVIYDNFSSGQMWHLDGVTGDPRLMIVRGDLKDLPELKTAMADTDTVFHLASNPDIAKAVTRPDIDFWEGTYLTQNILESMRINGVGKVFYTSGSGVYGDVGAVPVREDFGPQLPISTYAASKLAGEALICSYCHMFGMRALAFRFANVVGPRQTHGVAYDFIRRLSLDPIHLDILGDGSQSKAYIFVDDVLDAIFHVDAHSATDPYTCFNVATEDYVSVREIADMVVQAMGISLDRVAYRFSGGDRGWKGDVPIVRFDLSKIHRTGWRAKRTSREALRDAIRSLIDEFKTRSGERRE